MCRLPLEGLRVATKPAGTHRAQYDDDFLQYTYKVRLPWELRQHGGLIIRPPDEQARYICFSTQPAAPPGRPAHSVESNYMMFGRRCPREQAAWGVDYETLTRAFLCRLFPVIRRGATIMPPAHMPMLENPASVGIPQPTCHSCAAAHNTAQI